MSLDKVREYLKAEPFNSVYYDGEYKKPYEAPPLHAARCRQQLLLAARAGADVPSRRG